MILIYVTYILFINEWNIYFLINNNSKLFFSYRYTVAKNGGEYWVGKETESISVIVANTAKKN